MDSIKGIVQVWPDKFIKGISNLNGPHRDKTGKTFLPELGQAMSLKEALTTTHPTDAHVTCYTLLDGEGNTGPIPLMRKPVLKQIQAEGGNLYTTCFGFDWDTPGHTPMDAALVVEFLTKFLTVCELDERLSAWRCFYTSRHGTRIFYELEEPVKVEDGEKYIVSMLKEFKRHGLLFDTACKDWTRRFRLPKVVRDGLPTAQEPFFDMQVQDRKLDVKQFKKADLKSLVVVKEFERRGTYPDQEECDGHLYKEGALGRPVMTFFHKQAKSVIRASRFADNLFDPNTPLCGDTGRNEFFKQILGYLVPKLIEKMEATPEQIFSILHGPLCELEVLEGRQDPMEHCWNFLQDIYEREWDKYRTRKVEEAKAAEEGQTALEKMAAGMRQWCEAEELFSEDNAIVEAFVKGHIFANVGNYYYPMDKSGWYSSLCLKKEQLIPRVRKSYLSDIVITEKFDSRGDLISISPVELCNNHATVVHEVRMSPLQGAAGRIDNLNGDMPILNLPMYHRNEFLAEEYNEFVDGWLRALFGDNYPLAAKWIAYALDFEAGPICALSIKGPGSIGKKLLFEGLSECLEDPCLATGHDMCGKENGALLKTPFLVANEGLPRAKDMSPADTFKSLTAGDPIRIRELYKPPINVVNPVRIIFTANDHEIIHDLMEGKSISPETREAMGERLLHFDVGSEASIYLKSLGGKALTAKDGYRWIRGDSGQPSDFVVAKHFMWLYKNREEMFPRNKSDRYCVMGNCTEVESFHMAAQSEDNSLLNRAIIDMVERNHPAYADSYILSKTGRLYVAMQGVLGYVREALEERITERAVQKNIKSLMKSSTPYIHNDVFMYEIDMDALVSFAEPWGIAVPRIKRARTLAIGQLE